jgi:ubiquinone/menaquinone biosynthesis C-methylase UbiE
MNIKKMIEQRPRCNYKDYWNSEFAQRYDKISKKEYDKKLKNMEYLTMEITPDDIILDIGCGNGMVTKAYSKICKEIVGIDISKALIDSAKIDSPSNCSFLVGSVFNLDTLIGNQKFTKIYAYGVLQYIKPKEEIDENEIKM